MTAQKVKAAEAPQSPTVFVALKNLSVDYSYQRPLNETRVADLARAFDPDALGLIVVSLRADGKFFIIDGQHRVAAARQMLGDDNQLIECEVLRGLSRSEEAVAFKQRNDRLGMSAVDKFLSGLAGKEPQTVAIAGIVEQCGFKVDRQKRDGLIPAVGALVLVYTGFRGGKAAQSKSIINGSDRAVPDLLRSTLKLIRNAWGDSKDGVNGSVIEGVGRFLAARQRVVELPELASKLAQFPGGPLALIGKARGLANLQGGTVASNVAEVIVDTYNKSRRVGKIETLRKGAA